MKYEFRLNPEKNEDRSIIEHFESLGKGKVGKEIRQLIRLGLIMQKYLESCPVEEVVRAIKTQTLMENIESDFTNRNKQTQNSSPQEIQDRKPVIQISRPPVSATPTKPIKDITTATDDELEANILGSFSE